MDIEFSGAAREVTGSCHILRANGRTVVLDCGMFQGRREESRERNLRLLADEDQIGCLTRGRVSGRASTQSTRRQARQSDAVESPARRGDLLDPPHHRVRPVP